MVRIDDSGGQAACHHGLVGFCESCSNRSERFRLAVRAEMANPVMDPRTRPTERPAPPELDAIVSALYDMADAQLDMAQKMIERAAELRKAAQRLRGLKR